MRTRNPTLGAAAIATFLIGALAVFAHAAEGTSSTDTLSRVVALPELEVSTTRLGDRAPVARSTLTRSEVRERNWGQDTPMALATLPGAYAYSDAGNGIGYSYLSIRGFPQRRVSVLINGIPLNDPESHEVYWIDHPDLLSSTAEAQVQRGVGSALYGAASLGGSVNLETGPFAETPSASATAAYGSYDTKRYSVEAGSGRLSDGWNLYGRYSRIETLGYRDQSFSKLWSYALSARKLAGPHSLRINFYGGPEETHLAYLGVPRTVLDGGLTGDADRDRRFNPIAYPNERDHFFEPHYELIHSWAPNSNTTVTQTLFWFDGKGYYDEQRFGQELASYRLSPWTTTDPNLFPAPYYRDTTGDGVPDPDASGNYTVERFDLVRRRTVVNRHYGWLPRARFAHAAGALTVGGEIRAHDGRHYGEVISGDGLPPGTAPNSAYYDYHPRTLSAGLFAREEWQARPTLLVTADLAWHHQDYFMRGDQFDGIEFDQRYDFLNPRLGVTWTPRPSVSAFASWAYASREPAFRDLYDAEGVGSVPLYAIRDPANNVYEDPLIDPERVSDVELGATWRGSTASASLNLFRMDFRDELVYAGQFNTDLGYPILGNAARSVHQGVELAARLEQAYGGGAAGTLDANATFSDNHFVEFREQYGPTPADEVVYDGNAIPAFPSMMANLSGQVSWQGARLGAAMRYIGRIYVDATETEASSIDPYTTLDLTGGYDFPAGASRVHLGVRLFNALDGHYETAGYLDYDGGGSLVPHLVPAATRNVLFEVKVDW